ncbi:Gluconolactonase (EC [Olavius sp. associated proteobacterium Delta 1]|nr:Gluconolactonase (EC [Olavius sp. associated proteobacterium Delta 1]
MTRIYATLGYIDLAAGAFEPIAMPEADMPENRFNDGKVDENGRYWAGSMDDGEKLATGSLYRLDGDHTLHKMDENYAITNGPAFSVDGKTLHHTDTAFCRLNSYKLILCLFDKKIYCDIYAGP